MSLQSDGKIVVGGINGRNGNQDQDFALARYNTDGSLDSSFGTGGLVSTDFGTTTDEGRGLALQPDGKIVLAGITQKTQTVDDIAVARYNTDGMLDPSFAEGGKLQFTDTGYNDEINALAIQPDGKLLVAGSKSQLRDDGSCCSTSDQDFFVGRLNGDGSWDAQFGPDGRVRINFGSGSRSFVNSIALDTSGKIVLAGMTQASVNDYSNFALARLNSDGTLDSSFNSSGTEIVDLGGPDSADTGLAVDVQTDGKIVEVGQSGSQFALVRLNGDGTRDAAFGTSGIVVSNFGAYGSAANSVAQQGSNLVVGGYGVTPNSDFVVARYNDDGSLDSTFGASGVAHAALSSGNNYAQSLGIQTDGNIVLAGYASGDTGLDFAVARFLGTGAVAPPPTIHVAGNSIVDPSGNPLLLHGVNRSGTEYMCAQGRGIFDGPTDAAAVAAIASWSVNAVRIPLNEDCWLGINGVDARYAGANYQQAIAAFVQTLENRGIVPILELHWSAPGSALALGQSPMPDQDHSIDFWRSVAQTFKSDGQVVFDLFNEPYPDNNSRSDAAWSCWRDGGTCSGVSFQAAGMQELVNTVRATGARNLILLGGPQYANALDKWLAYVPSDAAGNLAASWHVYPYNPCNTTSCWDTQAAPLRAQVPILATEIGSQATPAGCNRDFPDTAMMWLDGHASGYLGWTWDAWGNCDSLITDYAGTPSSRYGRAFHDHLLGIPQPPTQVTAAPGDGSASISWVAPADAGSTPISSYVVIPAPSGAPVTVDGSTTTATIGGLRYDTTYTFTVTATNAAGRSASSDPSSALSPHDLTPPTLSCGSVDGAWHASDVTIACTASDGNSGLANPADASFSLTTSVRAATETANAQTGSHAVCDVAGNCTAAGPIGGNKVDKKPPTITITTPPAGTTYLLNRPVVPSFSCLDGGSGTAAPGTCAATPLSGGNLQTTIPGARTFTVSSKDAVGNQATPASNNYSILFSFSGFVSPLKNQPTYINVVAAGKGVPVRFSLKDYFGTSVYQSLRLGIFTGTGPASAQIACPAATKNTVSTTTTQTGLNYNGTSQQYEYDWSTSTSWSGTCRQLTLKFKDGTSQKVNFQFK
jgi:uncharacterized delta-60 repeat protein